MMELFHRSMNQVRKSSMPMGQDRKKQGPAERHEAVKVAEDGLCDSPQQAEGSDNHGIGNTQARQMVGRPPNKVREWGSSDVPRAPSSAPLSGTNEGGLAP